MKTPFHELLNSAQKVTLFEILATVCIAMLFVSIVIIYEARTLFLLSKVTTDSPLVVGTVNKQLVLSSQSVVLVEQFAHTHSSVVDVIGVVAVDLIDNSRNTVLQVFNDKKIAAEVVAQEAADQSKKYPTPLFTTDPLRNTEISSLLAGEFFCGVGTNVLFAAPYVISVPIKTTCYSPVPPYYGRLTGYIIIHSKRELSIYEAATLRDAALHLAINVYYADILRPAGPSPLILRQ